MIVAQALLPAALTLPSAQASEARPGPCFYRAI
jgi:hypothetical protein